MVFEGQVAEHVDVPRVDVRRVDVPHAQHPPCAADAPYAGGPFPQLGYVGADVGVGLESAVNAEVATNEGAEYVSGRPQAHIVKTVPAQ